MDEEIKKVSGVTNSYLARSQVLLSRLSVLTTTDSTLPGDIAKWIIETIDELLNAPDVVDIYVSSYYWCNWCVHSMYLDMMNNIKIVHLFNWHLYELAYKMFRSATELVNSAIEVLPKTNLETLLENIEKETFKCFFGEMVKVGRNKN